MPDEIKLLARFMKIRIRGFAFLAGLYQFGRKYVLFAR